MLTFICKFVHIYLIIYNSKSYEKRVPDCIERRVFYIGEFIRWNQTVHRPVIFIFIIFLFVGKWRQKSTPNLHTLKT